MSEQIDEQTTATSSGAPRSLEIVNRSSVRWMTLDLSWKIGRPDGSWNKITIFTPTESRHAANVAMQLNIFGVDAPKMGEWWLNANRRTNEKWEGEIVPIHPHPHDGIKITYKNELYQEGQDSHEAMAFKVVLPYDNKDLYNQGGPYYALKVCSSDKNIFVVQSRMLSAD